MSQANSGAVPLAPAVAAQPVTINPTAPSPFGVQPKPPTPPTPVQPDPARALVAAQRQLVSQFASDEQRLVTAMVAFVAKYQALLFANPNAAMTPTAALTGFQNASAGGAFYALRDYQAIQTAVNTINAGATAPDPVKVVTDPTTGAVSSVTPAAQATPVKA